MFKLFANLLCAAVLASSALAQNSLSVVSPLEGTVVSAAADISVALQRPKLGRYDSINEISLVIGVTGCGDACSNNPLGNIFYTGTFDPQWTDSEGNQYQNITISSPNSFDGNARLNVARMYLWSVHNTAVLDFQGVNITMAGAVG